MFDFHVSAERSVLDISTDLDLHLHGYYDSILLHNNPLSPAETIYIILPHQDLELWWRSTTSLTGPIADLVIVIQSDIVIKDNDFRNFRNILVSDNKFHHDGDRFLVIKDDEHNDHKVIFENCLAGNAYFLCNNLKWFGGRIQEDLFVKLHGNNTELLIEGTDIQGYAHRTVIGNLIIPQNAKPKKISVKNASILHNFTCEGVDTLFISDLKSGGGICRLVANEIEGLINFSSLSDELIVKAEIANIGSFIAPRGKVQIDVNSFIDFTSDGNGHFQGMDLNIDVSKAIGKEIKLPSGLVRFDKIYIKGASLLNIPSTLVAGEVSFIDCPNVNIGEASIGYFQYKVPKGKIVFNATTNKLSKIDSLFLIGNIDASFYGQSEISYLETDEGRSNITILDNFTAGSVYLNLHLNQKKELIDSENQGYFGLYVNNSGNKKVDIGVFLARLTTFNIDGGVKLGKVMFQPVDSKYNLLQVNVKYRNQINIDEFFVSFDHEIVIDRTNGKMTLQQSMDRALKGGTIIAELNYSSNKYITIRAHQGLSFHGEIQTIDGDIDLFTLFGRLSVSGGLRSSGKISLIALEGSLDLSATCNAVSLITYSKGDSYTHDMQVNATEFLSSAVGRYILTNSNINAPRVAVLSENDSLMIKASKFHSSILQIKARENVGIEKSQINSTNQNYTGHNIDVRDSNITGTDTLFEAQKNIIVASSTLKSSNLSSSAGSDIRYIFSQVSTNGMFNEAGNDISIRESSLISSRLHNRAGNNIEIASNSEIVSSLLTNYSGGNTEITGSNIYSSQMIFDSKQKITIDSSQILSDNNIFFLAVSNYLAVNSNISITQYPHKLFLHKTGIDSEGNPLMRCGFSLRGIEAIGIMGARGYGNTFDEFQYTLVNSSNIPLGIFSYLSKGDPKSIIIDSASGVIMGSQLSAKDHQVIIKAKHGIELLPLSIYNLAMFHGGITKESIATVITKIEAGLIDLDGGTLIKSVGALMRASTGNLKADYIMNESLITKIAAKQRSLAELAIWINGADESYKMIVNHKIVPTKLEFSEVTKIDVGKGKVDIFYPYKSKEVYLRQRQGDVNIDRNVHFPYEVMALHLDQGKLFFGMPKTETKILKFWFFKHVIQQNTIEHVNVSGNNLHFSAGGGIEVHGSITTNTLGLKSSKDAKIVADKHNFGQEVQKSVIRSDNVYITADNIEVVGSLVTVKNNLKLVSHNNIKIIPIELIHRYSYWSGSKTHIDETIIKQVVSEINAGMLNIDAGRAAEFVASLINVESLDIHAKNLKITNAREIFQKQIEFYGKKKWHGGRQRWSDYTHNETVIPTIIHAGQFRMMVDQDTTIEASQIFAQNEVLTKVGGNLTIKDGYNIHVHNHYSKKYSLFSFSNGGMRFNHTKSVRSLTQQTEGIPTLVCASGIFYGVVDGMMHILGSAIVGKDIHLLVPKGLKLEASKYTDHSLIFVNETGEKLGFYSKGNREVGVNMAAYATKDEQKMWYTHIMQSSLAAQDTLNIIVRNGTFEQISSQIAARIIHVEARNWVATNYSEELISEHLHQHVEAGIKIALKQNVTSAIDKVRMLINKRGNHVIDNADRIFKAYDAYKSLASLPTNAVSGGSYAYIEATQSHELSSTSIAVDNTISGETIIARIKEDIRFQGVQMSGRDVDLEAVNFTFKTSQDKFDMEYNCGQINIEVGISNPSLSNIGASTNSNTISATTHHNNYIKASGNLKITLSGDGKFKGVSLEGAEVDIKAKNLILESVQDLVSKKMSGTNFHIGLDGQYGVQGFGFGVEQGRQKSAWTKQMAQIIGTQIVNIVVKETLELSGSLIANAEEDKKGNLTDKGKLSINCGRLLLKTIHDYDQGVSLGIGASFQVNQEQNGDNGIAFSHAPLKVEFNDHRSNIYSTIGKGNITTGKIAGDRLNRDITQQIEVTKAKKAGFDSTIHSDMKATLTGTRQNKGVPTIKQITREVTQEEKLPIMLANYFIDVVDSFKGATKDAIIAGAKASNFVGMTIDTEQLDQRMHQLMDWQYGTKLSSSQIRRLEKAYIEELAKAIEELSSQEGINLEDNERYRDVINKGKYHKFFEKLQNNLGDNSENEAIKAVLQIYKVFYLKEQKTASREARPVKEFGQFIKEVNRNNIYTSTFFGEKIHRTIATVLGEVELLFANSQNKQVVLNVITEQKEKAKAIAMRHFDIIARDTGVTENEEWHSISEEEEYDDVTTLDIREVNSREIDVRLKEVIDKFVRAHPEHKRELERISYNDLKSQIIEAASQEEVRAKDRGLFSAIKYGFKELFGIQEARGNPVAGLLAKEIIGYLGITASALIALDKQENEKYHELTEEERAFQRSKHQERLKQKANAQKHNFMTSSMDISEEAGEIKTLWTPIPELRPITLSTPDQRDQIRELTRLKGFDIHERGFGTLQESFPIHETKLEDLVYYKDYKIDSWNIKPASVKEAPEVWQHNKYGKIYLDPEQKVGNKGIWWSKDTAKHAGTSQNLPPSTYKLFIKTKTEFEWIGDADATGKVIENKHKSKVGDSIPIKQCWKVK